MALLDWENKIIYVVSKDLSFDRKILENVFENEWEIFSYAYLKYWWYSLNLSIFQVAHLYECSMKYETFTGL